MRILGFFSIAGSLVCGLIAAWYWLQSSKVPTRPTCLSQSWDKSLDDAFLAENNWAQEFLSAVALISDLNKKAALWTAASVVFAAATSIFH